MVRVVELSRFIPQQLQVLGVGFWHPRHIGNASIDGLGHLIGHARIVYAPRIGRSTTIVDALFVSTVYMQESK